MPQYSSEMGQHIVGLQPDDRTPHDWLRMVARVFASYRKVPLRKSIVALIDGLGINLSSINNSVATFGIDPGQAFVDDQFIGLDSISTLDVDLNFLQENLQERYWIVLRYEWIVTSPPPEPTIKLIYNNFDDENDGNNGYNDEQMLLLGYITRIDSGGTPGVEITQSSTDWTSDLMELIIKDAEIDQLSNDPFVLKINGPNSENDGIDYNVPREGTLDIGWALDFHNTVGNNTDHDLRIHTIDGDTENLYINNTKIISSNNEQMYFLGRHTSPPTSRTETNDDGTTSEYPLENGDMYYDTNSNQYVYYKGDAWSGLEDGTIQLLEYIMDTPSASNDNNNSIELEHRIDKPTSIWVDGVMYTEDQYDASDPTKITFTNPLNKDEVLQIYTFTNTFGLNSNGGGGGSSGSDVGFVIQFAGGTTPGGYLLCDGTEYLKDDYISLYDIIGTTYGGDNDHFNVPDISDNPLKNYIKF